MNKKNKKGSEKRKIDSEKIKKKQNKSVLKRLNSEKRKTRLEVKQKDAPEETSDKIKKDILEKKVLRNNVIETKKEGDSKNNIEKELRNKVSFEFSNFNIQFERTPLARRLNVTSDPLKASTPMLEEQVDTDSFSAQEDNSEKEDENILYSDRKAYAEINYQSRGNSNDQIRDSEVQASTKNYAGTSEANVERSYIPEDRRSLNNSSERKLNDPKPERPYFAKEHKIKSEKREYDV